MTQDEIIEMAIQAGFEEISKDEWAGYTNSLEDFAKLVAAKEREACAQVAFSCNTAMTDKVAKEIRASGEA
jgi:hypothetical protein